MIKIFIRKFVGIEAKSKIVKDINGNKFSVDNK
jgi:hypothetical protein